MLETVVLVNIFLCPVCHENLSSGRNAFFKIVKTFMTIMLDILDASAQRRQMLRLFVHPFFIWLDRLNPISLCHQGQQICVYSVLTKFQMNATFFTRMKMDEGLYSSPRCFHFQVWQGMVFLLLRLLRLLQELWPRLVKYEFDIVSSQIWIWSRFILNVTKECKKHWW